MQSDTNDGDAKLLDAAVREEGTVGSLLDIGVAVRPLV
ncbi:hypothetical protein HNQ08_003007 [Deinococcus humi]|uniref:Uncharacterized protein n=1 Tax=Deinococcus humi TaxID=662880 RepID=A0A7W8NFN1_9DEIO|nr:hypothetical protein [Deinococcus humi]